MEQLDKVYETFTNLERDYKKSRKSRSKFIEDKFGGDIEVGSMIILDYFAAEKFEAPEDIEKLSRIRDIFEGIKRSRDFLDSMVKFDFTGDGLDELYAVIKESAEDCGNVQFVSQKELRGRQRVWHHIVKKTGAVATSFYGCQVVKVYNTSMANFLRNSMGGDLTDWGFVHIVGSAMEKISVQRANKIVNGEE